MKTCFISQPTKLLLKFIWFANSDAIRRRKVSLYLITYFATLSKVVSPIFFDTPPKCTFMHTVIATQFYIYQKCSEVIFTHKHRKVHCGKQNTSFNKHISKIINSNNFSASHISSPLKQHIIEGKLYPSFLFSEIFHWDWYPNWNSSSVVYAP